MKKSTQDDFIRTALRLPPDTHAAIHEAARKNDRSFNAEIVQRLEQSFVPRLEIPSYEEKSIAEGAERNGRSFEAEFLRRLRDAGDPVLAMMREALDPVRSEVIRAAENNKISIKDEISHRLASDTWGMALCYEITVNSATELNPAAAVEYLREVVKEWDVDPRHVTTINLRIVQPRALDPTETPDSSGNSTAARNIAPKAKRKPKP